MPPDRPTILAVARAALEPLPYVSAMFEGGSAAFGRADAVSDVDLMVDVDAGHEDETFAALEAALSTLAPIATRWIMPTPAWHGMTQRFYHLAGTPPYLLVDVCLRPADRPELFAEREHHGEPVVYFDKRGLVHSTALDREKLRRDIATRLELLRPQLTLMEHLVPKELDRGHPLDAIALYQALVVRPLVEALRMRYCPTRFSFGLRYVAYDLPAAVVARLEPLLYVRDPDDLRAKHAAAVAWCGEELAGLDAATMAL